MTTIAKADDKRRLIIPEAEKGRQYIIQKQKGGWWIEAVPDVASKRKLEWAGSRRSLAAHLKAMADLGLQIEPLKAPVPPCRF